MNFAKELYNKLTTDEWEICSYYIRKAQDYYDAGKDSEAREALIDGVAVCKANGKYNAAFKIEYYIRFC